MKRTWFQSGDWNALCDVCGFKRKASQLTSRWDGLMVCEPTVKQGCWEMRHPQELIRPIRDQLPLPWTRPESTDRFVDPTCSPSGLQGIADYAVADCWIVELDLGIRETPPFM